MFLLAIQVPIVKFQHFATGINVDISFNKTNGIRGVQVVKVSQYCSDSCVTIC